jgi:hypothetical protein
MRGKDLVRLTPDQLEEVRKLYAGDDLTNVQIAARYGQRPNWVNYLATKYGWPLRGKHWRPGNKHRGDIAPPPSEPKVRRAHAHPVKTLKQIEADRKAEDAERQRKLYGDGDLSRDVAFLRRSFAITREGDLYRVGNTLRTADQVHQIAARERRLQQPEPEMLRDLHGSAGRRVPVVGSPPPKVLPQPAATKLKCDRCGEPRTDDRTICRFCREAAAQSPASIAETPAPTKICGCGRALGHGGRCWVKRGMSGPPASATPVNPFDKSELCGCGRDASHNGRCWARRAQQGSNLIARVTDLEKQVAALTDRLQRAGVPA